MRRMALGTVVAIFAWHAIAYADADDIRPNAPAPAVATSLIERFLSAPDSELTSYRAFRTLEAEARSGQLRARLTAWTSLDPVRGFQYAIVEESGSNIVRQKVLRAALEAERSLSRTAEGAKGALTAANYVFTAGAEAEPGLTRINIHPKRHDTLLLEGSVLVTKADAELTQVEGFLVKRPSFWTRDVHVVRRYERIGGVRAPISMQSTARVLIVGRSTFSMAYRYASINGNAVNGTSQEAVRVESYSERFR